MRRDSPLFDEGVVSQHLLSAIGLCERRMMTPPPEYFKLVIKSHTGSIDDTVGGRI